MFENEMRELNGKVGVLGEVEGIPEQRSNLGGSGQS